MLPTETKDETPSPRRSSPSSTARPTAPLCDETATVPGANPADEKVAFMCTSLEARPRQLGPIMRAP